jgi:hypothetical protein
LLLPEWLPLPTLPLMEPVEFMLLAGTPAELDAAPLSCVVLLPETPVFGCQDK